MRSACVAAILLLGINVNSARCQTPNDLHNILASRAPRAPTLSVLLIRGDSISGILRAVDDSVLVFDRERIPFSAARVVRLRVINADPILDKAIFGVLAGGLFGLVWPLFSDQSSNRDTSTQLALSVVGFAAAGGGVAALIDSAFGRRVTWHQIWPVQ